MADADKADKADKTAPGGTGEPAEAGDAKPQAKAKAGAADKRDAEAGQEPAVSNAEAAADKEPAASSGDADAGEKPATVAPFRPAGLKLHHLRPAPGSRKAKMRVGRGEASKGKTAGRGTKGTKARDVVSARFEGGQMPLHRRLPKLRGFSNLRFKTTYQVVNTGRLAELYPDGGDVTPEDLVAKGAVRNGELVKVLGAGDVPSALRVSAHAFSASAKEKITAAGGTVTEL